MTPQEYDRLYAKAVVAIRDKLPNVGQPEATASGRILRIGMVVCDDEIVFALAWGKETARTIINQRLGS